MADRCLLYYITDRTALAADEATRRRRLLEKISEAVRAGVDYIQLREKDLSTRELESLAREAAVVIRESYVREGQAQEMNLRETSRLVSGTRQTPTAFLINSRTDIALAVSLALRESRSVGQPESTSPLIGVHLRSDDVAPAEVTRIWASATVSPILQKSRMVDHTGPVYPVIGVSCHSPEEVAQAAADGASFAVFAPVFEKKDSPGAAPAGLARLAEACRVSIPVLALGGVNLSNAQDCLDAGAAGIAGIRLFQENKIAEIAQALRRSGR